MHDKPMTYEISDGSEPGVTVIRIVGPAVLVNLFTLQDELRTIHPPIAVFDLGQCEYMDSAGLGVLMNFYVSAEKGGRKMAVAGASPRIEALLDLTHVKSLLRVFPTVEEAESA
jgi:anti-anti-sigma factor